MEKLYRYDVVFGEKLVLGSATTDEYYDPWYCSSEIMELCDVSTPNTSDKDCDDFLDMITIEVEEVVA